MNLESLGNQIGRQEPHQQNEDARRRRDNVRSQQQVKLSEVNALSVQTEQAEQTEQCCNGTCEVNWKPIVQITPNVSAAG